MPREWVEQLQVRGVGVNPGPSAALRVPAGVDLVGVQAVFRFANAENDGIDARLQGTMAHVVLKNVVQPPTDPDVWVDVIDGVIATQILDAEPLMGATATNLVGLGPFTFVRLLGQVGATPPDDVTVTLYLNGALDAEEG